MTASVEQEILDGLDFKPQCWRGHAPAAWSRRTTCGRVNLLCTPCHRKFVLDAVETFTLGDFYACSGCGFLARSIEDLLVHDTVEPLR